MVARINTPNTKPKSLTQVPEPAGERAVDPGHDREEDPDDRGHAAAPNVVRRGGSGRVERAGAPLGFGVRAERRNHRQLQALVTYLTQFNGFSKVISPAKSST